jgi:hypothetical protein
LPSSSSPSTAFPSTSTITIFPTLTPTVFEP